MSEQLGQVITNAKEMADILQQLVDRIEKLENKVEQIMPTMN
jgi:archaellum component FlaC